MIIYKRRVLIVTMKLMVIMVRTKVLMMMMVVVGMMMMMMKMMMMMTMMLTTTMMMMMMTMMMWATSENICYNLQMKWLAARSRIPLTNFVFSPLCPIASSSFSFYFAGFVLRLCFSTFNTLPTSPQLSK